MTYLEACDLTSIYKGIWDAETLYEYRDIVKCDGDYYFALGSSLNQNPISSDEYWELVEQDAEVAGRVASIPKGEWNSETEYKLLDLVTHNDKSYIARRNSTNHEPGDETDEYWMLLVEPYLVDMEGATEESDGTHGLAPEPFAGDAGKVLTADGQWRRTLQTSIVNNNNHDEDTDDEEDPAVLGYNDAEGNFLPFITYEEAVESSMIGTAQPENVLIGNTFSNASERGLSGTMRDFSQATQLVVTTDQNDADRPIIQQTKVNDVGYYEVSVPTGYWERSLGNSSILIPCEEKSISINGTTATITPSAGKVLSKVTCVSAATPTPTQTKTVTASRSTQTVKPDSGKLLSQVVINKFPDATGTFKCGSNNGASSNNDMGVSNNYRYVDATNVYNRGKAAVTLTVIKTDGWGYNGSKTETITQNYVNSYKTLIIIVLACSPSMSNTANLPCSCSGSSVSMIIDRGVTASNTSGILRAYSTSSFATNGTITVSGGHSNGGGLLYALCGLSK